jgi:hypothetical protein
MHKSFGFFARGPAKLKKYPPEGPCLPKEIKLLGPFFFLSGGLEKRLTWLGGCDS